MHSMLPRLTSEAFPVIYRDRIDTVQVNLGYRCNLSCLHCHVNAGPNRKEMMTAETVELLLQALKVFKPSQLDLTGGAPELNPHFRQIVSAAVDRGIEVIDRCNLTILLEDGNDTLANFLADNRVVIVASLPCYIEQNVNQQRGDGVFQSSIEALRLLNSLGYGVGDKELRLDLVFNPQGPVLPPSQKMLEAEYKKHLYDEFGVTFDNLLTIANMPINRFGSTLISKGQFEGYMQLLRNSFNGQNLDSVMCRSLISIDWQGYLYDCDFNQMLALDLSHPDGKRMHLNNVTVSNLANSRIRTADHCFGCTAGQGSGCGGAIE